MNAVVFSLLAVSHVLQHAASDTPCKWSGFTGCECNILGACDADGNHAPNLDYKLTGYAPKNVEQFRYGKNLAYLCERGTVTIMYDCNAKIPLYAATVMTSAQLDKGNIKRPSGFRKSGDNKLNENFQQSDNDYTRSGERNLCYEVKTSVKNYLVEKKWYKSKNGKDDSRRQCQPSNGTPKLSSPVDKGHLIAALYGKGNQSRIDATFTYTNVVPQFSTFNRGQWKKSEGRLIKWGKKNCIADNHKHVRMFIVVGAIPSTYPIWARSQRFFGKAGFSDFIGKSNLMITYKPNSLGEQYRVNVPSYMYTAACCTFRYQEANQWKDGTKSIAFYRSNDPSKEPCPLGTLEQMKQYFERMWPRTQFPDLFPKNPECSSYKPDR